MKIVLASGNDGKLRELREILAPLGLEVVSQREVGFTDEVEETGATFEENALLKARAVHKITGECVIADDSGLTVDFLGGRPGIYSHRYAGEGASDADRRRKLLTEMRDVPESQRGAKFVCAIVYINEKGEENILRGECCGSISLAERGEGGFGYDAIFMVGERSFAEFSAEEKNLISHRGQALSKLHGMLENVDNHLL